MKMYAKVESERAYKGQGGNKFLNILVTDEHGGILLEIVGVPSDEEDDLPAFQVKGGSYEVLRMIEDSAREEAENKLKGEKQKGECSMHGVANCYHCELEPERA